MFRFRLALLLFCFRWLQWTSPAIFRTAFNDHAGDMPGEDSQAGMTMQERWLSVDEIAAHLGVNPDTVYKWIERKRLPAHKVGRLWKFQVSEVNDWVRAGKVAEQNDDK